MTSGLWARRASRLLHPAIIYFIICNYWKSNSNGQRWIRTTEAICSRFTVCPLWPLGNLPIYTIWNCIKADDRTRTDNLLITNQLLCQLSHIGVSYISWFIISRSAYASLLNRHELKHINISLHRILKKWDLQGSNLWPSACKADALPAELRSHIVIVKTITETTQTGLEPVTSAVTGRRSNQLSHEALFTYLQNFIQIPWTSSLLVEPSTD